MHEDSTLVFRLVEPRSTDKSLLQQLLAAWQRLQSLYKRSDGPQIFATYYDGASERVSASEPVTSLKKLMN